MNARAIDADQARASLRPMRDDDLDAVMRIEVRAYPFPWTAGIFRDCLRAGYPAWVLVQDARILGYGVLSVAAGEAHVLNVCIDPDDQGQGHGRRLLRALVRAARGQGAQRVFLEVRTDNPARRLYHRLGFRRVGPAFVNSWWLFNSDGTQTRMEEMSIRMVKRVG